MKQLHLTLITGLLAAFVHHAGAAVLIYEGFNGYTSGAGALVGVNANSNTVGLNTTVAYAGTGLANYTVNSSGLTFSNLVTSGGSITTAGGAGSVVSTAVARIDLTISPYPAGSTLYSSYLVNLSSISGTTNDGVLSRVTTDDAAGSQRFQIQADSRSSSNNVGTAYGATVSNGSSGLATGTTYLMIGRFTNTGTTLSVGTPGVATVWALTLSQFDNFVASGYNDTYLDAASIGSGATNVTAMVANTQTSATFSLLDGLRAQFLSVGDGVTFDEMRYGSTLLDVAPITVPEPSTYAMLGFGLATLLILRRRQV